MTCRILFQDHAMYNDSVPGGKQPLVCYGFLVESGKCQSGCQEPRESICCCCLVTKLCPNLLRIHGLQPTRLLCPWDFPGKNIGVGYHSLLQGIFSTQGSNPHLLCGKWIFFFFFFLPLSHLESPLFHLLRVLVAIGSEFNEKFFDISEIFN